MSRYTFDLIRDERGLESLSPEWEELYAASAPRNPFLSPAWTRACWRHLCRGAEPFVLAARREGRLVGLAPLRLDRELGFRVLRFIGNGWSDYLGFLGASDEPGVEPALVRELQRLRGEWDLALLRQLAADYTRLGMLGAGNGLGAGTAEAGVAPYLAFPGDWAALQASGPGWLKGYARRVRRFERDGGTVERLTGAEAASRMDEVVRIEARSWKLSAGVARLQPGPGERLVREALGAMGSAGELELWLARVGGDPAGFEINFVTPERIWLYQGTYCQEHRKLGPGGVLEYLSIERAWKAGAREYDYLSGDEPYKAERTDRTRPLCYRALFPLTARGRAAYGLLLAPRWQLRRVAPLRAALKAWRARKSAGSLCAPAR